MRPVVPIAAPARTRATARDTLVQISLGDWCHANRLTAGSGQNPGVFVYDGDFTEEELPRMCGWFCRNFQPWAEETFDRFHLRGEFREPGKGTESGCDLTFADHVRDLDAPERGGG